ncbi:MAG: riboflavin synthase subunit alpha [Candidatus Lightella neohaematopini]|nr:riboflavin synthase subunit alpha [Candidatus Lightella neohaematopini]MCV2528875.1 riboflavin synthase subunit alpha [Candidatus Lightella neohaematopini]
MFTGIIQLSTPIMYINKKDDFLTLSIKLPKNLLNNLITGSSVSINGCCLTVTIINSNIISFDVIKETLYCTNLKFLKIGDMVNVERSMYINKEIGGHLISGHIHGIAKIINIINLNNSKIIWFNIKDKLIKFILPKGFISVDGISLTIGKVIDNNFCVYLIPETLKCTNLKNKKLFDFVNIEIDYQTRVIISTVEKFMQDRFSS